MPSSLSLPLEWSGLSRLTQLRLSINALTGTLPAAYSSLGRLEDAIADTAQALSVARGRDADLFKQRALLRYAVEPRKRRLATEERFGLRSSMAWCR